MKKWWSVYLKEHMKNVQHIKKIFNVFHLCFSTVVYFGASSLNQANKNLIFKHFFIEVDQSVFGVLTNDLFRPLLPYM